MRSLVNPRLRRFYWVLVAAAVSAAVLVPGPAAAQGSSGGSSDASLSGLEVTGFSGEDQPMPVVGLRPAFDSSVLGYGASAAFTPRVRVRATAAAAGASVEVDGQSVASGGFSQVFYLGNGTNATKRVVVRVTAPDGVTVRSYSVVVVNNPEARLGDLELSGAQIRPSVFSNALKEYRAWVPHSVESVRVTATAKHTSVVLAVNGKAAVSGQASDPVPLEAGSNLITVTATAPDGFTRSTYTVTVRRATAAQSSDASLSGISVWRATSNQPDSANDVAYEGEAFALSPTVSGQVREYWVEVPEDGGGYVAVAADTSAPGAKRIVVSGTRSNEETRSPKRDVVSGEASGPWAVKIGHSLITVDVTSLDGTITESYRLIVKRGTVDDPKGVSVAPGDGTLRVSWEQSDSPTAPSHYILRWRKAGETEWLNPAPLAAVGIKRSLAKDAPVVTAEDGAGLLPADRGDETITGLDNGTAYDVQVRALRITGGDVQQYRPLRWLASDWQSLTATPGAPRAVVSITPDHPTRVYGTADDLSYTVSGLADGDAADDVVTGALSRTAGDDAGSYPISMGTLAVASSYADEYELPAAPTVAAYEIEPRPIPAVSGVLVATRDDDGTTAAAFDTTNAAGVDVLPAELADFRAGGLVVTGSFPTAEAGTHNIAATYTLADQGAFKAANYKLLQTAATLQGRIDAVEAQPACTPAVGGDYDRDDDRLIEICDFEQFNAIRFDQTGDGAPDRGTAYEYLQAFPGIVAGGPGCPLGCRGYELVTDLDFDTNGNGRADQGDQFWNDGLGWEPMPILGRAYTGTFEGNGHTISNLYMDKPANLSNVGLFGTLQAGAEIRNLALADVDVSGGHHMVGALVGANYRGQIYNSHVSGSLTSDHDIGLLVGENHGRVERSSASGAVTGERDVGILVGENYGLVAAASASGTAAGRHDVGGLIGKQMNGARLRSSYAVATVTGTEPADRDGGDIGGLVGENRGKIISSMARAAVTGKADRVGGLIGANNGTGRVYYTYAVGSADSSGEHVGGLIGTNAGWLVASYSTVQVDGGGLIGTANGGIVAYSYWDTVVSGTTTSAMGTGQTTAALQSPTGYAGIYAVWNDYDAEDDRRSDDPWQFSGTGYPLLRELGASAELTPWAVIMLTADADPSAEGGADLALESIQVSDPVAIDPAFSADDDAYTITLPPQMTSVTLYGRFADPGNAAGNAYLAAAADLADFETLGVGVANEHLLADLSGSAAAGSLQVELDPGESQTLHAGVYKWKPGEADQAPFADHTLKKAYTLTISRAAYPADDADLKSLGINPGTLAFAPDTVAYRVDVASTVGTVYVNALTSNPDATVTVNGEPADTPVTLKSYGASVIEVVVAATDGTTTKTYTVTVNRARDTKIRLTAVVDVAKETTDDMQITGLALPAGFTIEPAFSPDHYEYKVTAPREWDRVEVTGRYTTPWNYDRDSTGNTTTAYIVADQSLERAQQAYNNNERWPGQRWRSAGFIDMLHRHYTNGRNFDLSPGEPTDIALILWKWKAGKQYDRPAQDNLLSKVYTLTVTQVLPPDTEAGLHRLGTSAGPVALVDGQTDYTLVVAHTVAALTVTPTPLHPSAVVSVDGGPADTPVALDYGANAVSVVVTAADGTTTKTYTLSVTRSLPAAPAAPAAVEIEVGLGNATVSWEAPSARTGVPLDFYEVRVHDSQGQAVETRKLSVADLNGDLSADFSGLSNGADYTFGVRAGNDGGAGAWLEIGVTMPTPTELSGLTIAAGPNHSGRAIAADALVYVRGTESYDVTVPAGMAQVVLTPTVFDPKTVVTINGSRRLDQPISLEYGENPISVAVSAAGETPRTYTVTVTRPLPPRPAPPYWAVDAGRTSYDDHHIDVRWGHRSSSGPDADRWDLELIDRGGTKTTLCICPPVTNDFVFSRTPEGAPWYGHTFRRLTGGETYTVRLRGVNAGGAGEWGTTTVTMPLMAELEGLRLEAITKTTTGNEVQLAQSLAKWRTSYTISLPEGVVGLRVLPEVTQPKTATINGKNSSVRANTYVTLQRGKTTDIRITVTEGVHTRTYTIAATVGGGANNAPTVASALGDVSGLEPGDTRQVSLSGVFNDADGDSLTVTARSSAPAVATVSVASGNGSLTVRAVAEGTATITVTADDGNGGTVSDTFTVTVDAANASPTVAISLRDVVLEPGEAYNLVLANVFRDADGDSLTITARSSATSVATVSSVNGFPSMSVRAVAEGAATITVTADDGNGGTVSETFTVTVGAANKAPTVASSLGDLSGLEPGDTRQASLSGAFNDADGDSLTTTARSSAPAVATVSVASGYGSLTVRAVAEGTATITVTADDGNGGTVSDTFTVTVDAANKAPTVASSLSNVSGLEPGDTRQVPLSGVFNDGDGDSLTVTAKSSAASVATVSVASGYGSLTVRAVAEGAATITVTADDGNGGTVSDTFTVTVDAANKAPTVASSLGDVSGLEPGDTRQVPLSGVFRDADGDSLTTTARSSAPAVATVSVASGYGSLTVRAVAEGAATITVTADDGNGGTVSDTFTVTVDASSTVPTVASPLSDVSGLKPGETRRISLDGMFKGPNGGRLSITARSSDNSVATTSVRSDYTTMTLRAVAEGAATITVTASDGRNTVSDAFTVTVEASDTASQTEPETQQPDTPAEQKDPVEHYDANGDGKIDMPEYRTALADYLGGSLSITDLMKVRLAYVRDA